MRSIALFIFMTDGALVKATQVYDALSIASVLG